VVLGRPDVGEAPLPLSEVTEVPVLERLDVGGEEVGSDNVVLEMPDVEEAPLL
jgi:hypothetical protein